MMQEEALNYRKKKKDLRGLPGRKRTGRRSVSFSKAIEALRKGRGPVFPGEGGAGQGAERKNQWGGSTLSPHPPKKPPAIDIGQRGYGKRHPHRRRKETHIRSFFLNKSLVMYSFEGIFVKGRAPRGKKRCAFSTEGKHVGFRGSAEEVTNLTMKSERTRNSDSI